MAYNQNKNPFTSPVRMEEESCEPGLAEGIFGKKKQCVNKGLNKQRREQQTEQGEHHAPLLPASAHQSQIRQRRQRKPHCVLDLSMSLSAASSSWTGARLIIAG